LGTWEAENWQKLKVEMIDIGYNYDVLTRNTVFAGPAETIISTTDAGAQPPAATLHDPCSSEEKNMTL
jgi:hypothetical protein